MSVWVSIDGTDGSGKSSLTIELANRIPGFTVLERDQTCRSLPSSHSGVRLRQLRDSVFGYPHAEPVWEYPNRYWLHALCSFFWLYHHEVLSTIEGSVLIDGWATKHWARFQLHDDPELVAEADSCFFALPWPHQILVLPRNTHNGTARATKPSEHGAFESTSSGFDDYQNRTHQAFDRIRYLLGGRVLFTDLDAATPQAVLAEVS